MVDRWDRDRAPWRDEPIVIAPVVPRDDASRESLVALYRRAFGIPPYSRTATQIAAFREELRMHVLRPGFTAFQAGAGDHVVGFVYGYSTDPRHRWHQNVVRALGTRAASWMTDAFAFAELAVHPDAQGYGIGRALHDEVLAAQPHSRAVLSTLDAPTRARVMYSQAGWRVLAENVRFPMSSDRYVIMGKHIGAH